jgi:ADP-heptose:LPS heptosyltransferase
MFGMGNFIMCTPAIQALSFHFGQKIPVLFETPDVKKLFMNGHFITPIIDSTNKECVLCTSETSNDEERVSDIDYNFLRVKQKFGINVEKPHTYVDSLPIPEDYKGKDYIVVIRGGIQNEWFNNKDPGDDIYKHCINAIKDKYEIVYIGSKSDYDRSLNRMVPWSNCNVVLDDLPKCSALINNARFIISNDTGLYHVAGALNKDIFILWKDTPFIKNQSPGKGCFYSRKEKWEKDFNEWIRVRL